MASVDTDCLIQRKSKKFNHNARSLTSESLLLSYQPNPPPEHIDVKITNKGQPVLSLNKASIVCGSPYNGELKP